MITGKSIAKGAFIVMAATLLSRLLGFVREMIIAKQFGLTGATDAYLLAFTVPSGVAMAIAATISAGFIPVFNKYMVEDDRENATKVANTLLNVSFIVLFAIVILATFFAPELVKILAPGFHGEAANLTTELIRIMFPALIFISLMGLASGYLNSHQHFLFPALGPMITSIVIIAFILVLGPSMGIKGLAIGTTVGFVCQFLIQLPMMHRKGFRYKPEMAMNHPGVTKAFKLMLPVLIASLAPPLMMVIERGLASKLSTGSISALNYAYRLMQLPQGLFVMAISVPLFPALSSFAAQKDYERLKGTMIKGLSVLALIMIPASAGLIALDVPIVRLLFERGAFEAKDTILTAYVLTFYALALLPMAARDIFRRGFYALQDTVTPVLTTVGVLVLNIIFDLVLIKSMGIGGLAIGAALSSFVETLLLYYLLNGKVEGLPGKRFAILIVKLIIGAVIMGFAAHFCGNVIGTSINMSGKFGKLIQVCASVAVGFLVYLGTVILLKVDIVWEAMEMAKGYYKKITHSTR